MTNWHVETDFVALFIFFILLYKTLFPKHKHMAQEQGFILIVIVGILTTIIDLVACFTMKYVRNWWVYQIILIIYMMSVPANALAWLVYTLLCIRKKIQKHDVILLHIVNLLYLAFLGVCISNPWTKWFFILTSDFDYSRGILFNFLTIGLVFFYFLLGIILVLCYQVPTHKKRNVILFCLFFFMETISFIAQLAHPGILVISAGFAIVYSICDLTIEEERRGNLLKTISDQNEQLEIAMSEAKEANNAKTDFLARMSHDMRTPMNAILGLVTLMEDKAENPDVINGLSYITINGKYLLNLINDTLDINKIEAGKLELHEHPVNGWTLLSSLLTNSKMLASDKGVSFIFNGPDMNSGEYRTILADGPRLEQIFMNLVSNAVKFTPAPGTVTFTLKRIEETKDEITDCYILTDTGIGMSEEFLKNGLFTPFSQEGRMNTNRENGTGLGMSIVKQLVSLMNGTIGVESQINHGTTITIYMTYKIYHGLLKDTSKVDYDEKDFIGKRVLLCEDHPINMLISKKLLEKKGLIVETAENGQIGLEMYEMSRDGYYDIILMDMRMPILNGIDATKAIRKLSKSDSQTIPIIAMTANAFDQDIEECIKAGMNAHLSKPVDVSILYQTIANYCCKK